MAGNTPTPGRLTIGQWAADFAAARIGSWAFLIAFNTFVMAWCGINGVLGDRAFDRFPYILLNLVFSWIAGVQAPLIMISQNRQEEIARQHIRHMITMQQAIHDHILASNRAVDPASIDGLEALRESIDALRNRLENFGNAPTYA